MTTVNNEVVDQSLALELDAISPVLAETLLSWQFSDRDKERVQALIDKNSANTLSPKERSELHAYVVLENLLAVLHAEAHSVKDQTTDKVS